MRKLCNNNETLQKQKTLHRKKAPKHELNKQLSQKKKALSKAGFFCLFICICLFFIKVSFSTILLPFSLQIGENFGFLALCI